MRNALIFCSVAFFSQRKISKKKISKNLLGAKKILGTSQFLQHKVNFPRWDLKKIYKFMLKFKYRCKLEYSNKVEQEIFPSK